MIAGNLDRKITLQRIGEVLDPDTNEPVEGVVQEKTGVWAAFAAEKGEEAFKVNRDLVVGRGRFEIRYDPDIDALHWRVKDDRDRIWDIVGEPKEFGTREGLYLFVELRR